MSATAIRFQLGARTLLSIERRLQRVGLELDAVLAGQVPALPPLAAADDGYLVTSLPIPLMRATRLQAPQLKCHVRQAYIRHHVDLTLGWDAYLARLSGNTRAAIRRKAKRWGAIDLRAYRTADELDAFHALARQVSALTYQERLLDAGLPDDPAFRAGMRHAAAQDRVRAFLLFRDGEPAAYLYCPAEGDTLVYDRLGHDPALGDLSPGAVLQAEALRLLMDEARFARFDFTEGQGQHKSSFSTHGTPCCDLLLLRPTLGNRAMLAALERFDALMAAAKRATALPALAPLTRRLRRA